MGRVIKCMAEVGDWFGDGRLLLESDALVFRGARQLELPLTEILGVHDEDGWLVIEHTGGRDRFDLGTLTPAWANAIRKLRGSR